MYDLYIRVAVSVALSCSSSEQKPIRSVLINGMCDFKDGTRAATAASKSSVGLDVKYKRLRHVVA